jgi:hypothetical protein
MDYEGDAPQEYEQIPWSHLVPVQKDRSMQLAVGAVAVVAVLLAGLFLIRRNSPTPFVVAATTVAPTTAVAAAPTTSQQVAATPPVAPSPIPEPQILSEADLMAVLAPSRLELDLLAIARAELFVSDYFTIDGDAGLAERIADGLPDAVALPETDGDRISYVEWARAVASRSTDPAGFVVTVWFRTLVGDEDGGFVRTPVRAVDVELVVDQLGRLAIADLPAVRPIEPGGVAGPWPQPATPPEDVVRAATDSVTAFGSAAELTAAGQDERGWRLLFSVGDASGLRFPLVVRIDVEP